MIRLKFDLYTSKLSDKYAVLEYGVINVLGQKK